MLQKKVCFDTIHFLGPFFLPFTEVIGLKNQIQKDSLEREKMDAKWCQNLKRKIKRGLKLPRIFFFVVNANNHILHSGGINRGRA